MTTEKRKHLAAWFSIIFIFVTLASLFYIVKEDCYPYLPEHRLARLSWLRYGSILYQLCSRTVDGEKMI